jgi:hypothetical protein
LSYPTQERGPFVRRKLLIAVCLALGLTLILGHSATASVPNVVPASPKGKVCKKLGALNKGFICKEVKGKRVWSARSKSTEVSVFPEWGSVTLLPFVVPVSGCKAIYFVVELDEPSKMGMFGVTVGIYNRERPEYVNYRGYMKDTFRWPATKVKYEVCAEDWPDDNLTRAGIKPNSGYYFLVQTMGSGGFGGGPSRYYINEAPFRTGE